jgi:death on curing protein
MTEEPEDFLYATIEEVLDLFPASLDLTSPSDEQLPEIVDVLTKVAICTNMWAVHEFGGRVGPSRGNALVEQVVAAAFQTFGGQDPHPQPFEKAAMLLRGITQGHPFVDGNKRTGFLVAMCFLERAGLPAPEAGLPREDVVEFCRRVSAGEIRKIEDMARTLAIFWGQPYP